MLCYSTPGLTWQAELRFILEDNSTQVKKLDLLTDYNMHMFLKKQLKEE